MPEEDTIVVHPAIKVVIEREGNSWGAYAPSIPGCIATAGSRKEVERLIEEALTFHLEDLHETGLREIAEELALEEAEAGQRS
jgi:predicted RNase H-like HicB family nuclease